MTQTAHPSESNAATAALDRMSATIAVAQGLALTGRAIDLAGLDDAAGQLCARLLDLSPSLATPLRPALIDLNQKVGALADLLASSLRQKAAPCQTRSPPISLP